MSGNRTSGTRCTPAGVQLLHIGACPSNYIYVHIYTLKNSVTVLVQALAAAVDARPMDSPRQVNSTAALCECCNHAQDKAATSKRKGKAVYCDHRSENQGQIGDSLQV